MDLALALSILVGMVCNKAVPTEPVASVDNIWTGHPPLQFGDHNPLSPFTVEFGVSFGSAPFSCVDWHFPDWRIVEDVVLHADLVLYRFL